MQTMKVKPWSEDQGDHVLINKADFDPERHEPLEGEAPDASGDDVEDSQDAPAAGARRGRKPKAAE
ncbi:MAG: hypothetical protein ACXU8R_11320 [Xanthobacteraceae bacterium]